jgi:hypothetical protein
MVKKSFTIYSTVFALSITAFLMGASLSRIVKTAEALPTDLPATQTLAFQFTKNLSVGMDNEDVKQLQIALNSDSTTQIASSGVGSPGQETTFFGSLTRQAVKRFQEKYRAEVLEPYDISLPTGFVGVATRMKLNGLLATTQTSNQNNSVAQQNSQNSVPALTGSPLPLQKDPLPRLYKVSPYQVRKGEKITLTGDGFLLDNTVTIGTTKFEHISPTDNRTIELPSRITSNLSNGTYDIWVENNNGTSTLNGPKISLTITDSPQQQPSIISVSPATTTLSGSVTITGTGFSSSGNKIISSFGTTENFSSNGSSITFSPSQLISDQIKTSLEKIPKGYGIKIDFYVVTPQGPTSNFGTFNLQL